MPLCERRERGPPQKRDHTRICPLKGLLSLSLSPFSSEIEHPIMNSNHNSESIAAAGGAGTTTTSTTDMDQEESNNESPHPNNTTSSTTRHSEDRLSKIWRGLETMLVGAAQKAEKMSLLEQTYMATKENKNEKQERLIAVEAAALNEYVDNFIQTRQDWNQILSYLEAKLEAREKENAIMENFLRTQSTIANKRGEDESSSV